MKLQKDAENKQNPSLKVAVGGYSDAGKRPLNQDAFAAKIPTSYNEKKHKGIVVSIADGVSCSNNSQQASQTSVTQFINDYYCTPETWSIKISASKVLNSLNSWLFHHNHQSGLPHEGLITTFSTIIFKSTSAYLFHVGDTRIYRFRNGRLKQISRDHQRSTYGQHSVLTRALGMDCHLDVDFQCSEIHQGDLFFLSTDGIHDCLSNKQLTEHLSSIDSQQANTQSLELLAKTIVLDAGDNGSKDNLTCLLVCIESLPNVNVDELQQRLTQLTIPPALEVGNKIDYFNIEKVIHQGTRSHVYLATDTRTQENYILKMPSLNFAEDLVYLDGFYKEQWIGRKLSHPNIMSILPKIETSPFLYNICEYIEGITLRQWMFDNPNPSLQTSREIINNIVSAVRVIQRAGMVHRDLKPENIMISAHAKITIIDFGTVQIDSLDELSPSPQSDVPLGDSDYIAPEYLNGGLATSASDLFSIAVIAYELLAGKRPYKTLNSSLQHATKVQWKYHPITIYRSDIPEWVDQVLKKAVNPNAQHRYQVMSEFITDLFTPNQGLIERHKKAPIIERHPLRFWQFFSGTVTVIALVELFLLLKK
ncbi:MAG: bifunctional protein-serine/threonine kinase/phosphatase [Psychromonas sp.]